MVSCYPGTPSLTKTYKDYIREAEAGFPITCAQPLNNSIFASIPKDRFRYFLHIVKIADMGDKFNNSQANFTVFAPPDEYLLKTLAPTEEMSKNMIINMDRNTAKKIISYNTIDGRLDFKTLYNQSPVYYLTPLLKSNQILVQAREGELLLDNWCKVLIPLESGDTPRGNGVVHFTDRLLLPQMGISF